MTSRALVDRAFALRSFSFSLDPGTGPTEIAGTLVGRRLDLVIRNTAGERRESRNLAEPPALSLNLPRALAARGLEPGETHVVSVFDPATLRHTKMTLSVQARELVRAAGRPVPAFRVEGSFAGVTTRTWIIDGGEVVKEESPMGLQVVRETRDRAQALAVPGAIQRDMLEASALVPVRPQRIDDPRTVARMRVRIDGLAGLDPADLQGAGQSGYQWRDLDTGIVFVTDDEGNGNVTQNSRNYGFGEFQTFLTSLYGPSNNFGGPAYFDIKLQAFDGDLLIARKAHLFPAPKQALAVRLTTDDFLMLQNNGNVK